MSSNNKKKISILWLDDHIKDYVEYIKGLRLAGFSISAASNIDDCLKRIQQRSYDLLVTDLRMPNASGFEVIRKVRSINEQLPICVLSSYLSTPAYEARLQSIEDNIGIIEKLIPDPDRPEFSDFVERLRVMALKKPSKTPSQFLNAARNKYSDPFKVSFHDFIELPFSIRKNLTNKVRSLSAGVMQEYFDDGYVWLLFCGDGEKPTHYVKSEADIPQSNQVLDEASLIGYAPYQFSAPTQSDDMWEGACEGPPQAKGYPTVSLELIKSKQRTGELTVHFDTGTGHSFLDYKVLDDLGLVNRFSIPTSSVRGGSLYDYIMANIKVRVVDQVSNGYKTASLSVRAVYDWDDCPFRGRCSKHCPHFDPDNNPNCKNRRGLIGRNLLHENKLSVILDGKRGKTLLP